MTRAPRKERTPTPSASAAAPGSAQDARTRPVTNHTAPVDAGSCAAVEREGVAAIVQDNCMIAEQHSAAAPVRGNVSPPKSTIWPAEAHTLAKHAILRAYLHAWFPILTSSYGGAIYFDGFAGPGRDQGGEEGSPVIALEAALVHLPRLKAPIEFIFV